MHDLDAPEVMIDRGAAHGTLGVCEAAELVDLVLERVGIDGPHSKAQ